MIAHNNSVVVTFKKDYLSGEPGLGINRLKFRLSYTTQAWSDKHLELRNVKAEVFIDERTNNQSHFLGCAEPDKPLLIKTTSVSYPGDATFNLILNSYQISLIEDIRRGDDLRFKLRILGETYGDDGSSTAAQSELPVPVNQKEWLDTLRQMKYVDFLLFEVPFPTADRREKLKGAVDFLTAGKNHFMSGHYDDTVAVCRKALESITIGLNEGSEQSEARKLYEGNQHRKMSKEQRALLIREAVRHYTHIPHHPSGKGQNIPFTRYEASFILGLTATLISFALQLEGVKSPKP